mgnify:CR=1 FL=1
MASSHAAISRGCFALIKGPGLLSRYCKSRVSLEFASMLFYFFIHSTQEHAGNYRTLLSTFYIFQLLAAELFSLDSKLSFGDKCTLKKVIR